MQNSRNYQHLAAERMARIAELELQLSEWKLKHEEVSQIVETYQIEMLKLNDEVEELNKEARLQSAALETAENLLDISTTTIEELDSLKMAQRALLKQIKWFLASYTVEDDLPAQHALQGLLDNIEELLK